MDHEWHPHVGAADSAGRFSALPRIVHLPAHAEQQRAANKAIQTPQNSTHNVTSLSLMIAACQLLASNTTQWSIEDE